MKFNKYILYVSGALNIIFAIFLSRPTGFLGNPTSSPSESRSLVDRLVDHKPSESKATDNKLVESKPATDESIDSKPADSKSVESKPTDDKHADSESGDKKPVEGESVDGKPVEQKKTITVRNYKGFSVEETYDASISKHFKIGIMAFNINLPLLRVIEGLQGELAKNTNVKYYYSFYSANNNTSLLKSVAEELVSTKFDLILSIGQSSTLMIRDLCVKRKIETPIVFAAVEDPVKNGIIPPHYDPKRNITGSSAEDNSRHVEQFELMLLLKPKFKRVLLPYCPSTPANITKDIEKVEKFLRLKGIDFKRIAVESPSDVIPKLSAFVETGDMIFTLRDSVITSAMEAVVKLACRHGATVFSSHIDTLENGVVIAFGGSEQDSGIGAAQKIRAILEEGQHPSNVPVTTPDYKYELVINKSMMKKQNFTIDPLMFFLIESGKIIEIEDEPGNIEGEPGKIDEPGHIIEE